MNTSEIFNPEQRKQRVVENFLNSYYGLKLSARGDVVQVQTLMSKLINENAVIASNTVGYENSEQYVKNTMILEALRQILKEIGPMRSRRRVNEQTGEDLAQAELILVAKNMVDKLQDMAEDVAKMQTDELMPLVEKMKTTFSQEQGQSFDQAADQTFATLLDSVKAAKDALSSAVGVLSGDAPMTGQMGGQMDGQMDGEMQPELQDMEPAGDEFGTADAASGEREIPGRELK